MMNRSYAFILAVAATGLVLSPAVASAQSDERVASVSYEDLDLSTKEGMETLNDRIDRAARYVCGLDETTLGTRIRSREARRCYSNARESLEESLADVIG